MKIQQNVAMRPSRALALSMIAVLLACVGTEAMAQSSGAASMMSFPLIDDFLCGFLSYSRTRLAPMVAVIVIVFSVVGHWLGSSKMWGTLLYVGLGLGVILGIGTVVANYTGVGSSCIV